MYQDNHDKFAQLRAIASGQVASTSNQNARNWNFEKDGDVMGTFSGFNSFTHPSFGGTAHRDGAPCRNQRISFGFFKWLVTGRDSPATSRCGGFDSD